MFTEDFERVIYCLPNGHAISVPDFIRNDDKVVFHQGLPNFDKFVDGKPNLIVLDDMMQDSNEEVMNLFTRHSHHRNLTVVFLVQNLFFGGSKYFRTISLNVGALVIMKNPREKHQITTLSTQLYPDNAKFFKQVDYFFLVQNK